MPNKIERIGVRLQPADAAALATIAETLRHTRPGGFISITAATLAAIQAAAVLARDGALVAVLKTARA